MPLKDFNMQYTNVSDLSPLKGMKLNYLACSAAIKLADLSPLHGMPLTHFDVEGTKVADLSPLKGMPLTSLRIGGTPVTDLSPLKDMKLQDLEMGLTQIADLSSLKDMPLTRLRIGSQVSDLSLLKNMPLKVLFLDFKPDRDTELLLRSLKTLETIDDKPAAEFWKALESPAPQKQTLAFQTPGFDEWVQQVQAMPAEQQVQAVSKKLVELNPGFDGQVTGWLRELPPQIEDGVVTKFGFIHDNVADLSPVRALKGLKELACLGGGKGKSKLHDLSPLKGMMLTLLACPKAEIADLSPLNGMPLTYFNMQYTNVSDLSPLKGMKLTSLSCSVALKLADLSPLHGMPLTGFDVEWTKVADLSPLKGMPLTLLKIGGTAVTDLSPLKDMKLQLLGISDTQTADLSLLKNMPLKVLYLYFKPDRDTELLLRSLKTLETIDEKPAAEFWKEVEGNSSGKKSGQ